MAKINQYPAKTVPSNNDEFVLHDPSAGATKKMTRGDLIGGAPLPANSVNTQAIADDAVTPEKRSGGYYAASITFTGGTGAKTLTGFGFKPKEVQFIADYTSASIMRTSIGGAVDMNGTVFQYCHNGFGAGGGFATSSLNNKCLRLVGVGGAVAYTGSLVSFDNDGVSLNIQSDDVNYRTWFVIARG